MQCRVMKPFNRHGELQLPGIIIEVSEEALSKLAGYVQPITPDEGRGLPHYCQTGACWCSALLPDRDHPADCILSACEYFKD